MECLCGVKIIESDVSFEICVCVCVSHIVVVAWRKRIQDKFFFFMCFMLLYPTRNCKKPFLSLSFVNLKIIFVKLYLLSV